MQSGKSIKIHLPLLIGLALSIALHVAALRGKGFPDSAPAKPSVQQGRTVVQLTLVPSISSQENPEPEIVEPEEIPVEPHVEQIVQPTPVPRGSSLPSPTPPPKPPPSPKPKAQSPKPKKAPAPEQDASLIQEKGVTSEAQTTKAISPTYPRLSQRRGEEGTVTLSIEVFANGSTGNIKIIQSSGYRRLDQAALKAARKTPFTPAQRKGKNIDSTTELSFSFKLTENP